MPDTLEDPESAHSSDNADWTLIEHIEAGRIAIAEIEASPLSDKRQQVCHHFSEIDPSDLMVVDLNQKYAHLFGAFADLGLQFQAGPIEAWELVQPSETWLVSRIPEVFRKAAEAKLRYQGWSWEPHGTQPISATDFQVINNRTRRDQ